MTDSARRLNIFLFIDKRSPLFIICVCWPNSRSAYCFHVGFLCRGWDKAWQLVHGGYVRSPLSISLLMLKVRHSECLFNLTFDFFMSIVIHIWEFSKCGSLSIFLSSSPDLLDKTMSSGHLEWPKQSPFTVIPDFPHPSFQSTTPSRRA